MTRLEQLLQQEQKEIEPALQQMHAAGAQARQALAAETPDLKDDEAAVCGR